ncbi:murein hydrolase activator EnvC family protein [Bacillus benzoevorans]|uniref:Peptidoglycan hydrolase CwlO-like protein n=1 Tax=Bacillus benzoevorans TaxID=1456 RepID=A0A7X0LW14_9BACI|nr:peptidoglycan DD-metalloendopeptidase family protein [Bacillus benzoevorans]MBB6445122.1 peptidoglycan hydrolase CwlO-like protein [Bacillus benzoevorans]
MKRSIFALSVTAVMGFSTVFAAVPVEKTLAASKMQDLQDKSNEIKSKRDQIGDKIDSSNEQLGEIQAKQNQVTAEINAIDLQIGDTETKIVEKNQQINEKKTEIDALNKEIDVLIKRIEERNEVLKERARSYQENGGKIGYIDVLIGAKSFSEFIDRIGAVAVIMEADQEILKQHTEDKKALEQKQEKVKADLASLETMRQELETLMKDLDVNKEEKNRLMAQLQQEETQVKQLVMTLEEQESILAGQGAAIQRAIELEQQRQREAAQAASRTATESRSRGGSGPAVEAPPVSSGTFTRPASGRLSSGFGYRGFNGGGFHYGVDIAQGGTVPVVAAADGVVIRSYFSTSYGNCIMIAHSVNGQTYTTVYAHLSSRSVEDSAVVSKGQQIGYMGNTGDSYGQHLHFELHRGPWNAAKSNAINPVGIVPL